MSERDDLIEVDDIGESLCRICREEGFPSKPLLCPCACKGSVAHVHRDCLDTWLRARPNAKDGGPALCELCGSEFEHLVLRDTSLLNTCAAVMGFLLATMLATLWHIYGYAVQPQEPSLFKGEPSAENLIQEASIAVEHIHKMFDLDGDGELSVSELRSLALRTNDPASSTQDMNLDQLIRSSLAKVEQGAAGGATVHGLKQLYAGMGTLTLGVDIQNLLCSRETTASEFDVQSVLKECDTLQPILEECIFIKAHPRMTVTNLAWELFILCLVALLLWTSWKSKGPRMLRVACCRPELPHEAGRPSQVVIKRYSQAAWTMLACSLSGFVAGGALEEILF